MKPIPDHVEARILKLRRVGVTCEEIRKNLHISAETVRAVLKLHGMAGRSYFAAIARANKRAGRTFIYRESK